MNSPARFSKPPSWWAKSYPLTIAAVEKQEMNDGKTKPVLKFEEDPRGLVLNVENRDRSGRTVWP